MPNNEAHSDHSYERYRVKASDLHRWMDEPSELYGVNHRWSRHDTSFIPPLFLEKYGKELSQAIMEDHILLDKRAHTREKTSFNKPQGKSASSIILDILDPSGKRARKIKKIRREHPNAYKKWKKGEERNLIKGYNNGLSFSELAEKHKRKKGAIRARLKRARI